MDTRKFAGPNQGQPESGPITYSIDSRFVLTPEQIEVYDGFSIIQYSNPRTRPEEKKGKPRAKRQNPV